MRGAALLLLAALSAPAPVLAQPPRIAGRIANPQGLQGMQVELRAFPVSHADALRQLRGEPVPPLASATPAADGSFTLQAPDSGFFRVQVHAAGRLALEHSVPFLVEDTELPPVELPAVSPVELRAVGADGQPLAGVTVRAHASDSGPGWRAADRGAVTDTEGKATFFRTAGETLTLTVTDPGRYGVATVPATGSAPVVRFPAPRSRIVEVRDGQGKPVAGALLRLARRSWPVGLTGPDGRIAMPIPARGELGLIVEDAKGLRLEVVMTQEAAEGTDVPAVTLKTPTMATGRVLGTSIGAGRQPIAGALVWSGGSGWTRSGPRGDFEVRAPAGDEGRVEAVARGRMRDVQPWRRDRNDPLTLILDPAGALAGQVVDEAGKPVAGARVRTHTYRGEERTVWSGADGRFTLRQLPAGRPHEVTAVSEGFAPLTQSANVPAPGRTAPPLRIVLGRGAAAVGRVVTGDGLPVAGAELSLAQLSDSTGFSDEEPVRAISDQAGRFRFPNVSPGVFDLQAKRAGFAPAFREGLEISAKSKEVDLGEIVLEAGAAIEGRVTDERGNPIARADVFLSAEEDFGAFFGAGERAVVTGADGRFRFPDLPRGRRFELMVTREGFAPASLPGLEARPGSPLRIELREGRTLAGRVVDADGEPVAEASISLLETTQITLEGSGFSSGSMTRGVAKTGEDGRFVIADLEPGTVELQVDAPGHRRKRVPGLRIPEHGDAPAVEIALDPGAAIEGRVLDAQGTPVRDAMVRAEGERNEEGVLSFAGGHTDADGRYRLNGLEVGRHEVYAESSERDLRAQGFLEVRPGTNRLDLTFPSGVEVSGRAIGPGRNPVAGASVQLRNLQSGQGRQATSGADGSFLFTDVVEGEYRLQGGGRGFAASSMPGTVRVGRVPVEGLELRLSAGAVIRGRIHGLAPEQRDEIHVSAHAPESGELLQGTVDSEGSYRVAGAGAGEWLVAAHLSSGGSANGRVQVREGDEEAVLDLQLPEGFTLSGRVLLDRVPLPGAQVNLQGGDGEVSLTTNARTAHDGSFSVSRLAGGSYTLLVVLSTGVGHIQPLEIDGDLDVTIEVQTGVLEGRLLSPEGLPVAGAVVSVTGQNPDLQAAFQGPTTRSDEQGYFELPRLAAGTYLVTARADGFAPAETQAVLPPGGTARVELVLSR